MPYFPGVAPLPYGEGDGYWAQWLVRAVRQALGRAWARRRGSP